MIKKIGENPESQNEVTDLIKSFENMPFGTLAQYTMSHNIYLKNGGKEGILISYMDMEPSDEKLNMLVDGETEYWKGDETTFVKAEKRI